MSSQVEFFKQLGANPQMLLMCLKDDIDNYIAFLKVRYVNEADDLCDKIRLMVSEGYSYNFRINSYLEMLFTKEENQASKFLYQECMNDMIPNPRLINSFNEIYMSVISFDAKQMLDISAIHKNYPEIHYEFNTEIKKIKQLNVFYNNVVFNNYINEYIFILHKIKTVLSKIYS